MQEGNWGDIEKVFQKTHVYLWFIVNFQFFRLNRMSLYLRLKIILFFRLFSI